MHFTDIIVADVILSALLIFIVVIELNYQILIMFALQDN